MTAPAQVPTETRRSCVYMLTDGRRVKIGTTTDLKARMSALSGACGVRLEILRVIEHAGPRVERWLHSKFASKRLHGEWFQYDPDMKNVQAPEEASGIPRVETRRQLNLTLRERVTAARERGDWLGLSDKDVLFTLIGSLSDEEAALALSALMEAGNGDG